MRKSLAPDLRRIILAFLVLVTLWVFSYQWMTVLMITISGAIGIFTLSAGEKIEEQKTGERDLLGWGALFVFFLLLLVSMNDERGPLAGIYRAGSLVFGGGHVVLPLLQESMVDGGYICRMKCFLEDTEQLREFPARSSPSQRFLELKRNIFGNPWLGAGTSLIAIFLPGMLLLGGTMRIWGRLRSKRWAQRAVNGANAGVVGVLGVALLRMATDQSISDWVDRFRLCCHFLPNLTQKNHPSLGSCHHLSYGRCSYRLEAPEMLAFREFSVHLPRPAKKSRFCHGKDSLSESLGCSHSGNPERWTHTTLYRNSPHSRGHQSAGLRDAP